MKRIVLYVALCIALAGTACSGCANTAAELTTDDAKLFNPVLLAESDTSEAVLSRTFVIAHRGSYEVTLRLDKRVEASQSPCALSVNTRVGRAGAALFQRNKAWVVEPDDIGRSIAHFSVPSDAPTGEELTLTLRVTEGGECLRAGHHTLAVVIKRRSGILR